MYMFLVGLPYSIVLGSWGCVADGICRVLIKKQKKTGNHQGLPVGVSLETVTIDVGGVVFSMYYTVCVKSWLPVLQTFPHLIIIIFFFDVSAQYRKK